MRPLAIGRVDCGGFLLHKEGISGCWEEAKKEEEEEGVRIRKRGSREREGREGSEKKAWFSGWELHWQALNSTQVVWCVPKVQKLVIGSSPFGWSGQISVCLGNSNKLPHTMLQPYSHLRGWVMGEHIH